MITVRPYRESDRAAVERVCISTAGRRACEDAEYGEMILNMYSRYYTSKSPDYCFVAVNEDDEAVGYIICAPDRKAYNRDYIKDEVGAIRSFSRLKSLGAYAEIIASVPYCRQYPAHLHIDLDESARHSGTGSRLMQALCEKLRENGVPGVMLIVGSGNTNAVEFYKRNGFSIVGKLFKISYVMGKVL